MKESKLDRISALPEPTLQHIMSFLPFKQVVQTSTVSKIWKEAWHTLPVLEFDELVFTLELWYVNVSSKARALEMQRRRKKVLDHLERILQNRRRELISIQRFKILIDVWNHTEILSLVDKWVNYVIESNVKELIIKLFSWGDGWHNVPQIIFRANSIEVLELHSCQLEIPSGNVKLHSLRKLCLIDVHTDDYVIENLLSGCPLIEKLELNSCTGFKVLEIFNLSKLKKIKLLHNGHTLERVEIKAAYVYSLEIGSVGEPCEIDITFCKNLKSLILKHLLARDEWLHNQVSELPLLEYLSITYCRNLESINISSPYLKTLIVDRCWKLVDVKIDTPNLSLFKYKGSVISFSSNTLCFPEADLYLVSQHSGTEWHFNNPSIVLHLKSETGKKEIIQGELGQTLLHPLSTMKYLKYSIK